MSFVLQRPGAFGLAVALFFSLVLSTAHAQSPGVIRRVNVPYLGSPSADYPPDSEFTPAIFWFGRVEFNSNYADVRVWYYDDLIAIHLNIPDRELWFDPSSSLSQSQLISSDAVSVLLDLGGHSAPAPRSTSYWFVKQLSSAAAAYRGTGSGWASSVTPFTTSDTWRGVSPNDPEWDVGWQVEFRIPFSSLGLSGPPPTGTTWGLGIAVHDRDDQAGTPIPDQTWPESMDRLRPVTWGELKFGRPVYVPPTSTVTGTTVIRRGLNGADVADAAVGGHTICGGAMNPWTEWGAANYAGYTQFNIQNQWDIADFMCFSKYYATFPLSSLPQNIQIVSAKVTLHLFGNAGYTPSDPLPSAVNALTVADDWTESTITWNNAPYALENTSVTWVYPVSASHPAGPYEWDVSYAAAEAYRQGKPLRLVFYSTDGEYHSGKYFYTSDSNDWNGTVRPSLTVHWGPSVAPPISPTGLKVIP